MSRRTIPRCCEHEEDEHYWIGSVKLCGLCHCAVITKKV